MLRGPACPVGSNLCCTGAAGWWSWGALPYLQVCWIVLYCTVLYVTCSQPYPSQRAYSVPVQHQPRALPDYYWGRPQQFFVRPRQDCAQCSSASHLRLLGVAPVLETHSKANIHGQGRFSQLLCEAVANMGLIWTEKLNLVASLGCRSRTSDRPVQVHHDLRPD